MLQQCVASLAPVIAEELLPPVDVFSADFVILVSDRVVGDGILGQSFELGREVHCIYFPQSHDAAMEFRGFEWTFGLIWLDQRLEMLDSSICDCT
jgi:hypothetical protein